MDVDDVARDADAVAAAMMGRGMYSFSDALREQAVDLSSTPVAVGRVAGGAVGRGTPESEFGYIVQLEGESLLVQREDGESVQVDISSWFDRQAGRVAGGDIVISDPVIEFDLAGTHYAYLVALLRAQGSVDADGRLTFSGDYVAGDLFADRIPPAAKT